MTSDELPRHYTRRGNHDMQSQHIGSIRHKRFMPNHVIMEAGLSAELQPMIELRRTAIDLD